MTVHTCHNCKAHLDADEARRNVSPYEVRTAAGGWAWSEPVPWCDRCADVDAVADDGAPLTCTEFWDTYAN